MSGKKEPSSTGFAAIDELCELDWLLAFQRIFRFLWSVVVELYRGIIHGTIPVITCLGIGVAVSLALWLHWDYGFLRSLGIEWLYPRKLLNSSTYRFVMFFSGFVGWAIFQAACKIAEQTHANEIFENAGLKNRAGQLPKLVAHHRNRDGRQRMRIARSGLSKHDFEKAKGNLESFMGVYVNAIEEDRTKGTVDITYSKTPIPKIVELSPSDIEMLRPAEYFVGAGFVGLKKISLSNCPHLLVAGETGSGKSTFLHQFITSLYRRTPSLEMTLIDLKGGLEFTTFEDRPGITVIIYREEATRRLEAFPEILAKRIHLLRKLGVRSVEEVSSKTMPRHVVIVDEAAEMFLSAEDNAAKAVLSQIARQGRALGIHLVMATQRPDTRALDPQIKANLTGVLCFKMLNDASSITVLGNGKATELPPIPGRALWKLGPALTELQAPLLYDDWAKDLLELAAEERLGKGTAVATKGAPASTDRFKPIQ